MKIFTKNKLDVVNLKVLGTKAHIHVFNIKWNKLKNRSRLGLFMWELMNVTFYKCYISNPKKVITSWDMLPNEFVQLFEPNLEMFLQRDHERWTSPKTNFKSCSPQWMNYQMKEDNRTYYIIYKRIKKNLIFPDKCQHGWKHIAMAENVVTNTIFQNYVTFNLHQVNIKIFFHKLYLK